MNLEEARTMARTMMDEHGMSHVPLLLSRRMTSTLGKATFFRGSDGIYRAKSMTLSVNHIIESTEAEMANTIKHEIAHLLVQSDAAVRHGHDAAWRAAFIKMGGDGHTHGPARTTSTAKTTVAAKPERKPLHHITRRIDDGFPFHLVCDSCDFVYGRQRQGTRRYRCPSGHPLRWNEPAPTPKLFLTCTECGFEHPRTQRTATRYRCPDCKHYPLVYRNAA